MPVYNALPAFAGSGDNNILTQAKIIQASTSEITVLPDEGYLIDRVVVQPTPTETQIATPSTSAQTITPTTGYYLSSVIVNAIQTETKSVTPTAASQNIVPANGKYLSSVTVNAIPGMTATILTNTTTEDDAVSYTTTAAYDYLIASLSYWSRSTRTLSWSGTATAVVNNNHIANDNDHNHMTILKKASSRVTFSANTTSGDGRIILKVIGLKY